ncbi:MAG: PAS domain S-box protein, partial [Bacteroidota bacterium]
LSALSNSFGIVEFDLDGFVTDGNEVFCDWLGFTQKEILSFSHHELILLENAQENPRLLWEKIKKAQSFHVELSFKRSTQDSLWLKGAYNLVFGIDKKPYKMILVAQNIHQQKVLMEDNRLAQIEIQARKEELQHNLEELKNSHEALESNQKQVQEIASQLTQILEGCVDSVITINEKGIIQFFNQAAENLWGYPRHEVIGQNVKMLMPISRAQEHDQYLSNYHQSGQAKVIGIGREVKALRKDGQLVPILLTLSEAKLEKGSIYTAFIKDITEKKRLEEQERQHTEQLLASEEELRQNLEELQSTHEAMDRKQRQVEELAFQFEQILEGCIDSVITINEKGTIQLFNQAAEELWGYARDEVIGKNVKMLMPTARSQENDQYLKNYQTTGDAKVIGVGREVEALRKDGEMVPILLTLSEAKLENGTIYTAFIKDITEKK